MRYRVTCMVGGKIFYVECFATNRQEAIDAAQAQYPNARIMSTNVIF
jgi:hypothetical protein